MDCNVNVAPLVVITNGISGSGDTQPVVVPHSGIFAKATPVSSTATTAVPPTPPFSQRVIASMARYACRADGACPNDYAEDEVNGVDAPPTTAPVLLTNGGGRHGSETDATDTAEQEELDLQHKELWGTRVRILPPSCQLKELHTLLRDRETSRSDFVFYADRLIRLVVEEALNCLPYESMTVTTPGGQSYDGLRGLRGSCGVSVMRSGEAMEKGLRDCCRAIRIGKMLIQREDDAADQEPEPIYVKLPPGVQQRRILLMQPVLGDGRVAAKALQLLTQDYRVPEANIFLLNIFSTQAGLDSLLTVYPNISVLTSEVHDLVPYHFCARYFGTD